MLNLAAFHDPSLGFDAVAFAESVDVAVTALTLAAPDAPRLAIGMADLAGLLAALGIDYDSETARRLARSVAAILRGRAEAASGRLAGQVRRGRDAGTVAGAIRPASGVHGGGGAGA